jgi:Zn-dependent alcohol dehydrogenase
MKTKGALLWELNSPFKVDEIDVGDPVADEVQIRLYAAGMCHSDYHLTTGATPIGRPALGGHEGAGVITKVGKNVTGLEEGDHAILAFIPSCGQCQSLYKSGLLKIDEMVTNTYSLENINDGYRDMLDGKNIRGVIKFTEADW